MKNVNYSFGEFWHPSNMYLKHTSAALSTFDKMDCIFIILDWRGAGWGICVFAVFSKYCKPSLLPSLWGSHTYRCRYCHRLTSGHITPSPSYHIPPPPYHHHSDILCHHHYNTINRLSYTTTTIPPSPWHHKPSNQTIMYHDTNTITYHQLFSSNMTFFFAVCRLGRISLPLLFISHSRLTDRGGLSGETLQLQQTGNFMVIANSLLLGTVCLR